MKVIYFVFDKRAYNLLNAFDWLRLHEYIPINHIEDGLYHRFQVNHSVYNIDKLINVRIELGIWTIVQPNDDMIIF
jgi:hypothetical protein